MTETETAHHSPETVTNSSEINFTFHVPHQNCVSSNLVGYPYLSKYERAALLIYRTSQLSKNATPVDSQLLHHLNTNSKHIKRNCSKQKPPIWSYYTQALLELNSNRLPFVLERCHGSVSSLKSNVKVTDLMNFDS